MLEMPKVDCSKCNGCGLCLSVCDSKVFFLIGNAVNVSQTAACSWCTYCEAICPTGAISCPYEIIVEK